MVASPVPKRLKEERKRRRLSQKQLGILAGIDEFSASPRMNQYECGKHAPDFLTIKHIADVLGVPTAYFYAEDDYLAEAIKLFASLPLSEQKKFLSQVQTLFTLD